MQSFSFPVPLPPAALRVHLGHSSFTTKKLPSPHATITLSGLYLALSTPPQPGIRTCEAPPAGAAPKAAGAPTAKGGLTSRLLPRTPPFRWRSTAHGCGPPSGTTPDGTPPA